MVAKCKKDCDHPSHFQLAKNNLKKALKIIIFIEKNAFSVADDIERQFS
jgi:hypothetical protein